MIEKTCVALLVPAVALKGAALKGKIVAAGPLTACTGFPEMARPWQHPAEVTPAVNGDPGISARLPVC